MIPLKNLSKFLFGKIKLKIHFSLTTQKKLTGSWHNSTEKPVSLDPTIQVDTVCSCLLFPIYDP